MERALNEEWNLDRRFDIEQQTIDQSVEHSR